MAKREPNRDNEKGGERSSRPFESRAPEPPPTLKQAPEDLKVKMDMREFESEFARDRLAKEAQEAKKSPDDKPSQFLILILSALMIGSVVTILACVSNSNSEVKPLNPRQEIHFDDSANSRHVSEWNSLQSESLVKLARKRILAGEFSLASDAAEKAVSHNPKNPDAYDTVGVIYFCLGDLERALNLFTKALAAGEDVDKAVGGIRKHAAPYFHRAVTLALLGQVEGSVADLKASEKFSPSGADLAGYPAIGDVGYRHSWVDKGLPIDFEDIYFTHYDLSSSPNISSQLKVTGMKVVSETVSHEEFESPDDYDLNEMTRYPSKNIVLSLISDNSRITRMKFHKTTEGLTLQRCAPVDGNFIQSLKLPGLKRLNLQLMRLNGDVIGGLSRFPSLTELVLDRCDMQSDAISKLGNSQITSLKWFPVRGKEGVSTAAYNAQFRELKNLGKLEALSLNSDYLDDTTASIIPELKNLKSLTLVGVKKLQPGVFLALSNCRSLERLELFGPIVDSKLFETADGQVNLRELSIAQTGMDAGTIVSACAFLGPKHLTIDEASLNLGLENRRILQKLTGLKEITLKRVSASSTKGHVASLQQKLPDCSILNRPYIDIDRGVEFSAWDDRPYNISNTIINANTDKKKRH